MSESNLSKNIIKELLEYLNLEFGNDDLNSRMVVEDLKYQGKEKLTDGISHRWDMPSLKNNMWAVVFISTDGNVEYSFEEKPQDSRIYKYLYVEIEGPGGIKKRVPFQDMAEYKLTSSGIVDLEFDKDKNIQISSEVCFTPVPPQVKIQLSLEDASFSFQSGLGIIATFSLGKKHTIYIEVGDLDRYWE